MTAGLGSVYRYFGKLVLVPFRYFSIDINRNIDISDNTTPHCLPSLCMNRACARVCVCVRACVCVCVCV